MNITDLITAMRMVKPVRLALVDLAWDCVGPEGFDPLLALPRAAETEAAIKEAEAYARAIGQLRDNLRWIDRDR